LCEAQWCINSHRSKMKPLLLLTLVVTARGLDNDRVIFSSSDTGRGQQPSGGCTTVSGPSQGKACVFPFVFGEKLQNGCITDSDPEGKYWCSTKVDGQRKHIANGDNWAHCSSDCPGVESTEVSSAFKVEDNLCFTSAGAQGTCKIPSTCIGATLDFIETNECNLLSGGPGDLAGVCCVPISIDNIINIIDTPDQRVDIPNSVSVNETNDIFLRFDFGGNEFKPKATGGFASDEPAADVVVDTNFIDDTAPTELHLRFNTPRNDIVKFDQASQIFLKATEVIKRNNNLTDLQASIGLRNGFNSDTSDAIRERCPWVPAPSCNPNLKFRSFDGSCNNLKNSNFGRTGTPFQRILLPDYAKGSLDLPRKSSQDNFELPSARTVSNALSQGDNDADNDNTILVMQMGQFIDHDITHTPNHGIQCCGRNGAFPASFDAEKCSPIRMAANDPFWRGRKTCMNFARSLSSPSLKCELQSREQLNQITHWIDGSNIYGSTVDEAMYLRSSRGKLKVSTQGGAKGGNLPSCEPERKGKVTGCDVCGSKKKDCFFAGDFRVNEQLNLIVLHTLFMREHNRIATELARINPRWSDDKIYQEARKINVAEYQHILFKEWLPIIIGKRLFFGPHFLDCDQIWDDILKFAQ